MPTLLRRLVPRLVLGAAVVALAAPGAVAASKLRDKVDLIERDLRDLQQRVIDLQAEQQTILDKLTAIQDAVAIGQPGRATPADLATRLDSVQEDLHVLFENQSETRQELAVVADQVGQVYRRRTWLPDGGAETPRSADGSLRSTEPFVLTQAEDALGVIPLVLPGPSGEGASQSADGPHPPAGGGAKAPAVVAPALTDPEELYQAARADYGRGAYSMAISGFQEFLELFPDSELADNSLYWIGESHYADGEYGEALNAFDGVTKRFPDADKTADAEYKKALCLLELNHTADGILQLQMVRDTHHNTSAARLARQKLQSLGLM